MKWARSLLKIIHNPSNLKKTDQCYSRENIFKRKELNHASH
jgi:hypothetical protein